MQKIPFIGLVLLLVACSIPPSNMEPAQVKGTVINASTGRPVRDIYIQLLAVDKRSDGSEGAGNGAPVAETTTNAQGEFILKDVPNGRFILINGAIEELPYGRIMAWNGNWEFVIFNVSPEHGIDLGILQVCLHSFCAPWPTQK